MKTAVIVFQNELSISTALATQAPVLTAVDSCELWILGGLGTLPHGETLHFSKITEILLGNSENLSEPLCCAEAVYQCFLSNSVDIMLFPAGIRGNDLAARVCAALGCEAVLGAQTVFSQDGGVYIKKAVYSNYLQATFHADKLPLVVSLIPSELSVIPERIENRELHKFEAEVSIPAWLTEIELDEAEDDNLLQRAELVLAAGRGVGRNENFQTLAALAQLMGGVLGGTRPTICDAKLPPERMIGMSANALSPACCLVFGASGAAPFLAGIEKSKLIVAVNKDPNAQIFDHCDVGIIADCNEFAQALFKILAEKD